MCGGGSVAQDGILAAGADGSQPTAVKREPPVSDGIDPRIQAMEPPEPQLMLNRAAAEPEPPELSLIHDPELPGGQIREFPVT
jgi:hypothetical protein